MIPTSIRRLPPRLALLFLVAIALPCTLLVILTLRMLVQEHELAEKRTADERRRLTIEVRQTLLDHVERLRRAASDPQARDAPEEIVFIARVENGRLVLPFERGTTGATSAGLLDDPEFKTRIGRGEELEFGPARFEEAAVAYRRAAASATHDVQRASAHLLAARALLKARRHDESRQLASRVAQLPATLVDDQGIPFALYAARLMADLGAADGRRAIDPEAFQDVLASRSLGPEAIYMLRDVTARSQAGAEFNARVSERVRDLEQSLQLRTEFATSGLPASVADEPIWLTFGPPDNMWLIHVAPADRGSTVTALRAQPVLAQLRAGFSVAPVKDGEPLAPTFPGLTLTFSPAALAAVTLDTGRPRAFYVLALVLVVGVAFSGAYLFWRDVHRDLHVAELRSQFVSSVSHELKTPLTAIRMFAETLLMGRAARPEMKDEYLQTIVNETERLTRLLNNVLDFSKIESGTRSYRLAPYPLPGVVRTAARAMEYPLAQEGFELRVDIDDDVPPAAVDPDAMQQAILNLLSNAMKYSGDGRVIDLSLKQDDAQAVIAVTDRGVGIPLDEQTRIFEKFYRISSASTGRIAGTGLGLTLVDHVTRGHGGLVTVRSAPGEGSTFAIHLPLPAGTAAPPRAAGAVA